MTNKIKSLWRWYQDLTIRAFFVKKGGSALGGKRIKAPFSLRLTWAAVSVIGFLLIVLLSFSTLLLCLYFCIKIFGWFTLLIVPTVVGIFIMACMAGEGEL